MAVSLVSFAYSYGLPREADLVFDARFLRNPHYDPILRSGTGLDPAVGAYIAADPDYQQFFSRLVDLVDLLLPRFVQEGKKYTTITIGLYRGEASLCLPDRAIGHPFGIPHRRAAGGRGM